MAAHRRGGLGRGLAALIPAAAPKLGDAQALNLIAREMSGQQWSPDTLDVIAAYVRGTGREIAEVAP